MLKVLYSGSPLESANLLRTLYQKSCEGSLFSLVGVLTNTPKPKGSHKTPVPTAVATVAKELKIPLIESDHCDTETRERVASLTPDILLCFAYGRFFGPKFLSIFPLGGINLHPSLLPKWRGPAPVVFSILNGDTVTGLSVQKITKELDSGDILYSLEIPLDRTLNAGSIMAEAAARGGEILNNILDFTAKTGTLPPATPQKGDPTYSTLITKESAHLTFNKSVKKVSDFVRAFNPDPFAWCVIKDEDSIDQKGDRLIGQTLKIFCGDYLFDSDLPDFLEGYRDAPPGKVCAHNKDLGIAVRCSDGFFLITKLQLQGKNPLQHKDFINGARGFLGKFLV